MPLRGGGGLCRLVLLVFIHVSHRARFQIILTSHAAVRLGKGLS